MDLCDKCKKNIATVHVEEIVNNVKSQYNLCAECAQGYNNDASFDSFFKNFLEAMFSFQAEPSSQSPSFNTDTKCMTCGLTYSDFKQTSRFGCADCYGSFRPQIDIVLKNIQGSNRHEGKYPNKNSSELIFMKQLGSLKASLAKAIEDEEYEQAAMLRDKIKELQAHTNKN